MGLFGKMGATLAMSGLSGKKKVPEQYEGSFFVASSFDRVVRVAKELFPEDSLGIIKVKNHRVLESIESENLYKVVQDFDGNTRSIEIENAPEKGGCNVLFALDFPTTGRADSIYEDMKAQLLKGVQ